MAKVKCSVCANENDSFCEIKKVKISLNKKRLCKAYVYDEGKLKRKQNIVTTRIPFSEQAEIKKKMKIERKKLKEIVKQQRLNEPINEDFVKISKASNNECNFVADINPNKSNTKHPVTGDLSRFISSGAKSSGDNDEN